MDEVVTKRDAIGAVNDVLAEYIPTFKPWQEGIPLKCARKITALPPAQTKDGIPISYLRKKERQCRNNGTWAGIVGAEVIALIIEEWEGGQEQ